MTMNVSTLLAHIDNGHMALPEFQRGYVWNRDQVKGLMESLYRKHPVGSLLVWATKSETAHHRGEAQLAPGVVKLLLDGQQRITSLYGIIRGKAPKFFDGNAAAFTGLWFHLGKQEFAFHSPIRMKDDSLWIDVSALMQAGNDGVGQIAKAFWTSAEHVDQAGLYMGRINRVLAIKERPLHVEEVVGEDKTIDVVVDIFNKVNSGGTKLSKGDLALAKVCSDWPEARDAMKAALKRWRSAGYNFNLDWLLRNVNTVINGEARFTHLHGVASAGIRDGLARTEKTIDFALNLISGRLGLDHDRVFFGRYALAVMSRYIDQRGSHQLDARERDRLLFWFVQSAMWGRFSGSTESMIDKDLDVIEEVDGGIDRLISELRLWKGTLSVSPGHFGGWSLGARFYPVLYMLTRVGDARDWGTGLPLKANLLGKMSRLEVHHIFPKSRLYKAGFRRPKVNAVANFCFLTKDTNLQISNKLPERYFAEFEANHPGALASQWIPTDPELWKLDNYTAFLEERRRLLADACNGLLAELLHDELEPVSLVSESEDADVHLAGEFSDAVPGSIDSTEEEMELLALQVWVQAAGLPAGELPYELADPETGAPVALLDLAWPDGLQHGFSQPVAVLLNEPPETLSAASAHGFKFFTSVAAFKAHAEQDALGRGAASA